MEPAKMLKHRSAAEAAKRLVDWLAAHLSSHRVAAVAHRVVHGGLHLVDHQIITPRVLRLLHRGIPIDPAHLPVELALIHAAKSRFGKASHIACLDTAFHHAMPAVAKRLAIPRYWTRKGLRRLGFHGISYSYLIGELARLDGAKAARGRVILAHLGAGSSMAAIDGGKSLDTTMSFTPTAGLIMATRCGDIDPGLLVYLLRAGKSSAESLDRFVNRECGLLGISETTGDMHSLLARSKNDVRCAEAVSSYVYAARKHLGSLAAVMGGLDTLVFAGGIGENAAHIRADICRGFDFLGLKLNAKANRLGAAIISDAASRVRVRIIPTDEQRMMATLAQSML